MFHHNARSRAIVTVGILFGLCTTAAWADPPGGSGVKWIVEGSTSADDITAVRVCGTPYQMGWWYGYLLAAETRDNINKLIGWTGWSEAMLQTYIDQQLWADMAPYIPQAVHDEMDGIVAGAAEANPPVSPAITLTELRRVVALVELMGLECTSICAVGSATHDGRLIQVRVLDTEMGTDCQDNPVITVYRPDDGPAYCNVGFACCIGSLAGINSEGIAMSEVGLHTPDVVDWDPSTWTVYEGIPMAILMKKVLAEAKPGAGQTALDKAIDIIETGPRTSNYSYGVGDGTLCDARSVITSRAQCHYWGTNTSVTIHHASDPNTKWLWDPNVQPDGFSGCDDNLPALVDVTYLPNSTSKTLDLINPSSPNYIGPLEPNTAVEVARRLSLNSNLMDVVYDAEDLKLWVSYAEGGNRAAEREFVEFDFDAAANAYTIDVTCKKPTQGSVTLSPDPNDPNIPDYGYPSGTAVTLTAEPNDGKIFKKWRIFDPNHPGDANYMVVDTNNPITIVMNGDYKVTAIFKCGGGAAQGIPLLVIGGLGVLFLRRRRADIR